MDGLSVEYLGREEKQMVLPGFEVEMYEAFPPRIVDMRNVNDTMV